MASRRTARVAEAIRETVSTVVLFQLRDPRIRNVSIVRAEVTADLRNAKVYVSVRGSDSVRALTMKGLNAARGFLQAKVADRLQTRATPVLSFVLDDDRSQQADQAVRILDQLAEERRRSAGPDAFGSEPGAAFSGSEADDAGNHESPEETAVEDGPEA